MLHLLFLFFSYAERCDRQCFSWVNLWKRVCISWKGLGPHWNQSVVCRCRSYCAFERPSEFRAQAMIWSVFPALPLSVCLSARQTQALLSSPHLIYRVTCRLCAINSCVVPKPGTSLFCANSVSEASVGKVCLRHAKLPILCYLLCPSIEDPSWGNVHQLFSACSWWLTKNSSYKIPQLKQCFSVRCLLLLLVRSYGLLTWKCALIVDNFSGMP